MRASTSISITGLLVAGLLVAAGCQRGEPMPSEHTGVVRITIHDAPAVNADEVWVTFDRLEVHSPRQGWQVIDEEVRSIDLMTLTDGVAQTLGVATLPVGTYNQIRLHVRDSHVVVGAASQPLTIPSGGTSGIEIAGTFDVPPCGEVEIELDWDVGAHLHRNRAGFQLRPTIDVTIHEPDATGCCGDALCVGGVCAAGDVCQPGGGEQLIVHEGSDERVRGYFGQDGLSVRFSATQEADGLTVSIASATGEPLIDVDWHGDQFRTELFGGGLVSTVDLAVLAESQRLAQLPIGEAGPFSLAGAITTAGDRALADALVARPEYPLLPWLSRSLGAAGFNGRDYPMTVPLHRIAMQAALDLSVTLPPLPMARTGTGTGSAAPACQDLRGDPNNDKCYGMCGPECSCWEWTCGDCCCHDGCAAHDTTCRNCKWYKPWNCVLCYTGLSFLAGLCSSCGNGGGGFYEPSCVGVGGACTDDHDCCGARNGTDERHTPIDREFECVFDGSGNGTCRRQGTPVPPVCGDGVCADPESCATCPADCQPCTAECNANGTCDGYPEDCGTCPGDCPCAPGSHCEGRTCMANPPGPVCGDGTCSGGEGCSSCPTDCGVCPPGCGDGTCAPLSEDCSVCPPDCPCPSGRTCSSGVCLASAVCGDGSCSGGETCGSCPSDCGQCPAVCGDGVCAPVIEDCGNCPGDCPCWMPGTACFGGQCHTYCGNGTCEPVIEDNCNCPGDCPPVCGNGTCDCQESCVTCPSECGACP